MSHITIETTSYKDATIGRLFTNSMQCFTLELPWRQNMRSISCIPAGLYEYKTRLSPSKGTMVLELIDVPNRTFIQIHAGNYTSQIEGCILLGDSIRYLNDDKIPDVTNSRAQVEKLLDSVPENGTVHIIRHNIK